MINLKVKCNFFSTAGFDTPVNTSNLKSERGSRNFTSLELDTVLEERSDYEQSTTVDLSSPE